MQQALASSTNFREAEEFSRHSKVHSLLVPKHFCQVSVLLKVNAQHSKLQRRWSEKKVVKQSPKHDKVVLI